MGTIIDQFKEHNTEVKKGLSNEALIEQVKYLNARIECLQAELEKRSAV